MKFGLGQPVQRVEDLRFTTGRGKYTDDITLPHQLRATILRSPHAHARIVSIDTSEAAQAPGVAAVFTGDDVAAAGLGDPPCLATRIFPLKRPDGSDTTTPPRPLLARERVRYVGDYVALVLAETLDQARDAAELIAVDYDPLPSVSNPWEAIQPGAPLVWDECADNICFVHLVGDKAATDAAFEGDCVQGCGPAEADLQMAAPPPAGPQHAPAPRAPIECGWKQGSGVREDGRHVGLDRGKPSHGSSLLIWGDRLSIEVVGGQGGCAGGNGVGPRSGRTNGQCRR